MRLPTVHIAAEIPTSSMEDIAFLFSVGETCGVVRSPGCVFSPHEDESQVVDSQEAVVVEVLRGGGLVVDRKPMEVSSLLGYLEPMLKQEPMKPVIFRPRSDAEYGTMVGVFDVLRQGKKVLRLANHINVSLPTEQEILDLWR